MTEVLLRFLGSGDAFGSGGRLQTCLHLSGAADDMLIDCGTSSLIAIKRAGLDPSDIGFVALTHLHGDHFGGLPFLILDGQVARRTKPLHIAGPPGTEQRLNDTTEALFPGATRARRAFDTRFTEFQEGAAAHLGPATITPIEVRHESGAPAYALRIEYGGRVVAYSGDTEWTDNLLEVASGADVFVCEAYFFDKKVPYHLDYETLADKRDRLQCERIVLTHMNADMLARLSEVELEAADDGAVIRL